MYVVSMTAKTRLSATVDTDVLAGCRLLLPPVRPSPLAPT